MEYIHYWRRVAKFDAKQYGNIVRDFRKVLKALSPLVPLAGGLGKGRPVISSKMICFNGVEDCGHTDGISAIACPDENAGGIVPAIGGDFSSLRRQRICYGNCSHKDFTLPLEVGKRARKNPIGKVGYYDENGKPVCRDKSEIGLYFDFCDTAHKVYDLAVMACLIIAKHHLKNRIIVGSTVPDNWTDGMLICQKMLGYGLDFRLDRRAVK